MFRRLLLATAVTLAAAAPAWAEWYEASSKHFVVYSDDSLERVKEYTQRLERFDRALRVYYNDKDPDRGAAGRVVVYVVPTVDDVQKLRRNAAGFWVPFAVPISVMPRNTGAGGAYGFTPQAVMFHEYTHHWMLTSFSAAALPAWYTEGAAEFHATAQLRPDGSIIFGAPPTYRQYGVDTFKNQMPVESLLRATPGKLDELQSAALYGRGWLLTHYLNTDPGRRKQLSDYIFAINSGKTIEQATPLLGNVSDLKLDAYVRQPKFASILIPGDKLAVGEVKVRQLTPGEVAAMPAKIRSKSGVNQTTAPQVAVLARRIAAQWPADVAVQNELAEAEFDAASLGPAANAVAGYARAEAAADRALAADPKSVHALLYKGMAKEETAVVGGKTDAATWNEVRRWYLAANRIDTENAEPLIRFYESFGRAKQTPSKSAEGGALYAYALAPHYLPARLNATKVLLNQGKPKQARQALAPIAFQADSGAAKELAKVMTALDADDAPGAIAAIKELEDKAEAAQEKARKGGKSTMPELIDLFGPRRGKAAS